MFYARFSRKGLIITLVLGLLFGAFCIFLVRKDSKPSISEGVGQPAPQSVEAAKVALETAGNVEPIGSPTVVGWHLKFEGNAVNYNSYSIKLVAKMCVDYNPRNSRVVNGTVEWTVPVTDEWHRAYMGTDGLFLGPEGSFYWTECNPDAQSEDN